MRENILNVDLVIEVRGGAVEALWAKDETLRVIRVDLDEPPGSSTHTMDWHINGPLSAISNETAEAIKTALRRW